MKGFFKKLWYNFIPSFKNEIDLKKFLIVGLGNIGDEYDNTRHNIGFNALDEITKAIAIDFEEGRYGSMAKIRHKGRTLLFHKPATFMNNSGKAVRYWAIKENIPLQNILIITDDLNLPFGTLRLKSKGSDGGHNGLKDIQAQLNTPNYPRLRFGINSDEKGYDTVNFVLGRWSEKENKILNERYKQIEKFVFSFVTQGIQNTMNELNGK